jgi:hypothetical protein
MVQSIVDTSSSSALICGQGLLVIVLIGPRVLPLLLTGNHYQNLLLHDLPKLLEGVPLAEHECGTRMMLLRHTLAALCEMFSISWPKDRQRRTHCIASTLAGFESSGFLPVGTPKALVYAAPVDNEVSLY